MFSTLAAATILTQQVLTQTPCYATNLVGLCSGIGNEILHGPVAAHCMIALNPNVPSCRLIWSLSCTVKAPSIIPATNAIVTMV
jgi:hypothetical protein